MAHYYMDENGRLVKKKKEEEKEKKLTGNHYYMDSTGKLVLKERELDNELAPTKPAKKEEKVDFFKKGGLFEDGYDFGDVWRTAGLTIADTSLSILEGLGGMAEGVLDLGGHIVAGGADLLGADEFADDLRKVVNHNTVSEAAEWIRDIGGEGGIGEGSVLGRTTKGVGQGVGQIGGILLTGGLGSAAGLGAVGTTALTTGTMFASSTGAGVSEAYNDGASDAEAWAYGTIKGGVDAASELIFGGLGKGVKALGVSHGLSSADDILAKKLSSKISSKVAKTFVQAGVKASGEGLEEVLAGLGTAAAKMIYKDGVSYQELLEDENLLEQFVVGALSSGLSQSGGVVNSVKTGTDFISGMTANEETVVNKEVEKRIAQEETNGNKLSNKEKNAIYESVVADMDKGYISTDTIEEALGGDTFKAYQDAIKSETAVKEEYEKLANTPKGELTHIQEKRLAELEAQIEAEPKSKALKQQLQEATFNLAKDSRLAETYNEQGRRTQAFQADLTKYDAKQAEVVKKAVESGILNNTNRTHEFVDMVAKISADKGVSFDFANNAKIKESGFAVDGATVNGFVTDSGITVNIQSSKALNTVVGHEITHILEGTELYDGLQKAVVEYAKTKGEYDSRLAAITKLYEGKNADVNKELVADLVGDYLFTDSDFIARLSTENRNVFQKIYDEIKYLAKVATAGSKEARQLEKAKRAFEKVYKESKAAKGIDGNAVYNIGDIQERSFPNVTGSSAQGGALNGKASFDDNVSQKEEIVNEKLNEVGLELDADSETVSYSLSSLEDAFDYNKSEEEYWTARSEYANALAQSIAEVKGKPTAEEIAKANRYLDSLFLIHDMIAADKDRLDYEAAVNKSAWVGNSEYGGSIDFSTLCAKRRLFTGTFDAIQNALPDTVLNENDFLQIRNMLLEKELESPCSMCYVEGSRAKHGEYVARFLKDYLKTNPEWKPQIADFTSTTRLEQTRIQHPEAFAAYQQAMNKLAQRKPKEASVRTDYKGEILRDFANNSTVAEKNKNGGVRFNSFSDFEIIHALDCMQVLTDMARVGLNGQSYTKVKEFAEAFGNTGLKINLSLVAKDVDANGKLIMDETNGMKYAEAMDIRNRYSENVGTVIVVFNDAQLKAALADSSIDFVLPFHRSQWKKSQYTMMGLPTQTKDYTMVQNDRITNPATGKPVKLSKLKKTVTYTNDITGETFEIKGNIMPNQYWDFSKSGRENAQRYLDFINANKMTPKFDSVLEKVDGKWVLPEGEVGDGYFKLLIDFKMYDNDGWGAPQNPVTPDFNMPYIQQMLDNYVGGHQAFPVAHDVVDAFVESKKGVKHSLSNGEQKQYGNYNVYGKDIALQEDIAPVREDIQPKAQTAEEMFPDDNEPLSEVDAAAMNYESLLSFTDEDAPPEIAPVTDSFPSKVADPLADRNWADVGNRKVKAYMFEHPEVRPYFITEAEVMQAELRDTQKGERIYWEDRDGNYGWTGTSRWTSDSIAELLDNGLSYEEIRNGLQAIIDGSKNMNLAAAKRIELVLNDRLLYGYKDFTMGLDIPPNTEYLNLLKEIQSTEANAGSFDSLMEVADELAPPIEEDIAPIKETVTEPVTETVAEEVPENKAIRTVQQRLEAKLENAEKALEELRKKKREYNESIESEIESISQALNKKKDLNTKVAQNLMKRIIRKEEMRDNINADYEKRIADQQVKVAKLKEEVKSGESPTEQAAMRAELHENMIDNIKSAFAEKGFDFDKVLENAKDLSTFSTVDNTPQRVLEKSLGYKEGKVLADLTVNKVAENETKAIRWLNSITDRKNGLLAQLSKQYKIKPGSKESAAAQMYAEGFYVNENDEIIAYGDAELAKDFPNAEVRKNIKGLARDPRIREFYDAALAAINESRARNAYPEIKPLKNYFLHFRAMDDTFSRLGIPFNPNDIKAKDLPTDLNGVTADLKPGQPYFASSMHRKGKRTSFDLLGGIEQYATGASRQIFHIDDIQTLRALRNYVADTFGQAKGLEDLDLMTEEEAEAKIKEVYGAHLSTFAKFLNEEANVVAGKTALTDRGLEGIIGRRGITFLDSLNKQVGANMIGFNISSSLTNLIAPVQAFAKSNKAAFVKAMAQTASNRLKSIKGQSDGFMEQSPVAIRRKGADRFARTPWQKVSDMGYVFMSAVDGVSTEIIARAKYNELTKKGMDSEQAHIETDKWVSRLMGDRSLGQQPQLYNSKMLGMFTKFQLEVRNQLDAQFYDTIQEAKLSNEEIKNELERNAKTAAKVTKTFVELAVLQHLFGKAFEAVAGYNPAFDIISALIKAFGFDDDEDDDDTFTDNLWEGAQELLGDLPYTSTLTGGRIPISSALPVEQFITGKDSYGNEKSRWETLGEAAPYYLMPGGYGQFKKTSQGLGMFDDDLPIAGSYTDSGNLRFPVAPTLPNIAQAAVFGQYASKNARNYFDNEYAPLKEKQIQEFIDLDIPIRDYRDIREGLKGKDTLGEKVAYIATLDLPIDKKNILVNNAANREEPIDMSDYGEYTDWGEFDYAKKYPDKYAFLQANGISVKQYNKFDDETKEAWSWAYQNPEKFALSKSIASDVVKYRSYTKALSDISADKDENGKSISGSRKEKVISYINNLDADYGEKIILFKSEYPADDTYNYEIVEYLGSREDITYDEMITILYELGFTVKDGRAYWD